MAGSFDHTVNRVTGELRPPRELCGMLETMSGDVYEAIEEYYGMVWWLATEFSAETARSGQPIDPDVLISAAQQQYRRGLIASPSERFHTDEFRERTEILEADIVNRERAARPGVYEPGPENFRG